MYTTTLIFQGKTNFKNDSERINFISELLKTNNVLSNVDDYAVTNDGKIEITKIYKRVAAPNNRKEMFTDAIGKIFKEIGKCYSGKVKMFIMEEK